MASGPVVLVAMGRMAGGASVGWQGARGLGRQGGSPRTFWERCLDVAFACLRSFMEK